MIAFLAAGGIMDYLDTPLLPALVCLLLFYLILIRPQQKKQRELEDWIANVSKGDEVVTSGGLWGKVHEAEKGIPYVVLEFQDKLRMKVLRSALAGKPPEVVSAQKSTEKDKEKDK